VEIIGTSKGKETQMTAWTPYVLVFLFGMATPVFFVRGLLRRQGDSGACIMEFILFALAVIALMTLWLGLRGG
jgi:cytochrome c oxidase assembly factor CtaG